MTNMNDLVRKCTAHGGCMLKASRSCKISSLCCMICRYLSWTAEIQAEDAIEVAGVVSLSLKGFYSHRNSFNGCF